MEPTETKYIKANYMVAFVARLLCFCILVFFYGTGSFYYANNGIPLDGGDTEHYVIIADNIAEHGAYSRFVLPPFEPDSLRTPLLPFYFLPFIYLFGFSSIWFAMLVLQAILALTACYTYKLARFFLSLEHSFIAALFAALEPLLVYRSLIAEPDALFVLLFVASLYYLVSYIYNNNSRDLYFSAAYIGLSILAKPVGLYLIPLFAFFAVFHSKKKLATFALFLAIASGCVLPWMIRNRLVFNSWGISSISTYNFYSYYTSSLASSEEPLPSDLGSGREPERNLTYAPAFSDIVGQRIRQHPSEYLRLHLTGTVRNFFASDFATFYYAGHSKILPFPGYDPENKVNLTALIKRGNFMQFIRAALTEVSLPDLLFRLVLMVFYLFSGFGLVYAYKSDKRTFSIYLLFCLLVLYFAFTPGSFVDAKYRLSAMPLLIIMALYGVEAKGYKINYLLK